MFGIKFLEWLNSLFEARIRYKHSSEDWVCSITDAELWSIFYGIQLAWNRGYRMIPVETDSLAAVNLIQSGCPTLSYLILHC
ncbi:putative ribonuclease H protein [Spatholobus suberectus]|nr:putative ribonuclease H protein [Spatholobus suberectus]